MTINNDINGQLDKIDGYIPKDTDIDQWSARLDAFIKNYSSVDYHWGIIESKLREERYSQNIIDDLKERYIKSFNEDSFDDMKNQFMLKINDSKMCIDIITSLVSLIKLLA